MISEKTVELNLTTEFLNYAGGRLNTYLFAIAPSQRQEAKLGYDVGILGNGGAILIQYKRAYPASNVLKWKINYTQLKDQHSRLLQIEKAGIPVYYAFPHFHESQQIAQNRKQLLLFTSWVKPSSLTFSGKVDDHHEVCYNQATKRWWTSSSIEIDLTSPDENINEVIGSLEKSFELRKIVKSLNSILLNSENGELLEVIESELLDIIEFQSLIIQPENN